MNCNYDRKSKHSIDQIMPLIPEKDVYSRSKHKTDIDGDIIKMNSQRYQVFKNSLTCVTCNCVGSFFAKERNQNINGVPTSETFHLNLYSIKNGEEMLMTKDHIVARANGGKNHLDNYQTMCSECNEEKGST
jgi:5-methylcytosine-specific restriction endonuclease McrA